MNTKKISRTVEHEKTTSLVKIKKVSIRTRIVVVYCQVISIYGKFVTSQTTRITRADINMPVEHGKQP